MVHTTVDGMPSSDVKAINILAINMFSHQFHDRDTPEEQTNFEEHDDFGSMSNEDNEELTDDDR